MPAASTPPRVWPYLTHDGIPSIIPPVDTTGWDTVYFGISNLRDPNSYRVHTPTFSRNTQLVESGLVIRDFDQFHGNHDFVYHVTKALVPHGYNLPDQKSFWLVYANNYPSAIGEQWIYSGWNWIGGTPGPLPPASPGTFNFTLILEGARAGHSIRLTSPDSSVSGYLTGVNPGSPTTVTMPDPWHPPATWASYVWTKAFSTFYSGPTDSYSLWTLSDEDSGDYYQFNPQTVTNVSLNLTGSTGWHLPRVPVNLQISLSRLGHSLTLRQRDSLQEMAVIQGAPQGGMAQYNGQTYY